MMNKFINDPDNLTAELLEGYVMAYYCACTCES